MRWPGGIQALVGFAGCPVVVIGQRQDLIRRKDAGDLIGSLSGGAQVKDTPDDSRRFFIRDEESAPGPGRIFCNNSIDRDNLLQKVCLELLEPLFRTLSAKDRSNPGPHLWCLWL